jgi:L-malate glycosyltransferase
LVGATSGDAITNIAFRLRQDLRRLGPSEIYAHHRDRSVNREVMPLRDLSRTASDPAAIIYHSSIGDPVVTQLLMNQRVPIVLCFHNVTPPEFFLDHDPHFAMLLAWASEELRLLRRAISFSVADSSFNASILEALGYSPVSVLPLGVEPERLLDHPSDQTVCAQIELWPKPHILVVSQLLPHKKIERVLQAHYVLTTFLELDVSLVVVGRGQTSSYLTALNGFIARYGLRNVYLVGCITDRALATHFRAASLYVSASAHEGLGVPALEAMAFGVPVIVRAAGAVPETVGSAAMLVGADDGPEVLAEVITRVLFDTDLRKRLLRAGARRAKEFDAAVANATFIRMLEDHL